MIRTELFSSGSNALYAALKNLGLENDSIIAIPDYYCDSAINRLKHKYKILVYKIDNNLLPNTKSLKELLNTNVAAVVLVQYFNTIIDLEEQIREVKKSKSLVIIDAIHLYSKSSDSIYKDSDATIYSIKKPLLLNEGAITYVRNRLLTTSIQISSISLKRNIVSLIKIVRLLFFYMKVPYTNKLFSRNSTQKIISRKENFSYTNKNYSADIISILAYVILKHSNVIYKLNKNREDILSFYNHKDISCIKNTLTFGFEKKGINDIISTKTFLWPSLISKERSIYWTENANNLYQSKEFISTYFDLN